MIGETDNLQATLLALLLEPPTGPGRQPATGFVFELCDQARRPGRRETLMREYSPASPPARSR